ncbi:MAG TPA: peptidyl-prolyl cis-trans isomerase [Candidatus Latescibacteria bacterium]|nr:peptidyl-prolyl cis-trans isomerase [Candidatus Latescibacterota bacterium]
MQATFNTSIGNIVCELYPDQAPITVENFSGLAEGSKEWTDPKTSQTMTTPLYSDTIFHRVIPDFMIQGGDPLGLGTGGPGYKFEDECHPDLSFDQPGRLAMANAGPGTNGSQFFITHISVPHLDGKHTIFGQVIEGQYVVDAMGNVKRGPNDRPTESVVLKSITIER